MGITLSEIKKGQDFCIDGTYFVLITHQTDTDDLSLCQLHGSKSHVFIAKTSIVNEKLDGNVVNHTFKINEERQKMIYTIKTFKRWNRASIILWLCTLLQIGLYFVSSRTALMFSSLMISFVTLLVCVLLGAWFGNKYKFEDDENFN